MKTRWILTGMASVSLVCSSVIAENWPQFRGPNGSGVAASGDVPLEWSDDKNLKWKCELPGGGSSSPIVWEDRIFLTAFTGYGVDPNNPGDQSQLKQHVICVDRTSGKILWNESHAASENEQSLSKRVADHGYATNTPATDGDAVYAYFGVSGVVAHDAKTGKLLWSHKEIGTKTAGFGTAASPILYKNLVIVNGSIEGDVMIAFDKKTGQEAWRVENIDKAWTTPTIATTTDGKDELIVNQKGTVFGFDPTNGKQLWSCRGIQDYVVPTVVVHKGIAYCLGGRSNRCLAIKLGGRGDVTDSHKLWEVTVGANVTSPIYHDGYLYWASDKGIAFCLNTVDGEIEYRERLPVRGRIYASMVCAGDKLYITSRDKGVYVIEAGPEYQELAHNTLDIGDDLMNAGPAISKGQIFLRTNSYLYCIEE